MPGDVTLLLAEWKNGNQAALDELTPIVYGELRQLAASYMRNERGGHTIQPTALVHEAYLRLVDQRQDWGNRSRFFGVAARLMRLILVDHARKRSALKRGCGLQVTFDEGLGHSGGRDADLVALDDALRGLAAFDERKARIIELRYFGGLTIDETAEALGLSAATVERDARMAQLWLAREMKSEQS